jgi:hypothetical protein
MSDAQVMPFAMTFAMTFAMPFAVTWYMKGQLPLHKLRNIRQCAGKQQQMTCPL